MKKIAIGTGIFFISLGVLLGGAYLVLAGYYSKGFTCGVYINDIYCTGYDVETVNQMLAEKNTYHNLTVTDKTGDIIVIHTQDVDFKLDYTEQLRNIQVSQSPYKWIYYYFNPVYYSVEPEVCFDEELVREELKDARFMRKGIYDIRNSATVKWTSQGYVLDDDTVELLLKWKAENAVIDAILNRESGVNLKEAGCYADLIETDTVRDVYSLWEKVDTFQSFKVNYQMGNEIVTIGPEEVSKWIKLDANGYFVFDENGDLILDEEKVYEFTRRFAEKYDTYGKPREFKTTKGEVVTIEFSKYGNDLDEEKEARQLIDAFYNKRNNEFREPIYKTKARNQGDDDIGGTYIEVDMTAQKLYFYQDYELKLESGVVTGNMRLNHDTPAMIASIYYMQKNRVLRGENYASFVYYWMAFYRGYGLHDATWRRESEFGTDRYLTNGSHGCVNLPKNVAAQLYDYIEIGTPVITYY